VITTRQNQMKEVKHGDPAQHSVTSTQHNTVSPAPSTTQCHQHPAQHSVTSTQHNTVSPAPSTTRCHQHPAQHSVISTRCKQKVMSRKVMAFNQQCYNGLTHQVWATPPTILKAPSGTPQLGDTWHFAPHAPLPPVQTIEFPSITAHTCEAPQPMALTALSPSGRLVLSMVTPAHRPQQRNLGLPAQQRRTHSHQACVVSI
jgi:hypothetical protein